MSYLGATPLMVEFLVTIDQYKKANGINDRVRILEIGVDTGIIRIEESRFHRKERS